MKLSELLKEIKVKNDYTDREITNITADSRKVKAGYAFVCIKGNNFDGHDAAAKANEMGAAALIVERDVGQKNQVIVENTREAYSLMCAALFGYPSKKLKLIGITGTNGKTTTSYLIKDILERAGRKTGLIGTVNNIIGEKILPSKFTTPDAIELQELFSQMAAEGCEYCVMEVSSQALAQGRVKGCHFDISVFTNLTQDHLDYHKTMEEYRAAKHILFENSDAAVINLDDENAEYMVSGTNCRVVSFSVNKDSSDYTAKNVHLKPSGVEYELVGKGVIGRAHIGIPGMFSVYNSMGAAVCAIELGVSFAGVLDALSKSKGVKGRVEVVPTDTDYTVIIDYAHTPDGLENVITALREIATERIITVFGCGGDRDSKKRPLMGEVVARLSDYAVVTSDNPRSEEPMAIINDILEGMKDTKTPYKVIENRREAIRFALRHAKPDDIVLLAGKGHETYQILKTETIHFDEREVVADILNEK